MMTPKLTARILLLLAAIPLSGCIEKTVPLACITNPTGTVVIERDNPSALDGYTYRVCTAPNGTANCTGYNDLTVERPDLLSVDLSGRLARVASYGGSVSSLKSDSFGMSDPEYKRSVPIAFDFHPTLKPSPIGILLLAEGKSVDVAQTRCP